MNYLKFLTEYRKAAIYWIAIFTVTCTYSFLTCFYINKPTIYNFALPVIVIIIYAGFYTGSYTNYLRYNKLIGRLKKSSIKYTEGICRMEIREKDITISPVKQNYGASITVPLRKEEGRYIITNGILVLFYTTSDLGVFTRHIKPVSIILNESGKKNYSMIRGTRKAGGEVTTQGNITEIRYLRYLDDIYNIKLIDFQESEI